MFGLDLKSIVVGILIAYFLLPMVLNMFNRQPTTNRNV
jgi:hypothetical protein